MEATTPKRIHYLDMLRTISIFSVIVIHVTATGLYGETGSTGWKALVVYSTITRFSVPVFFMISGALFLSASKSLSIKQLYFRNITKIIVLLLFWEIIYQFYHTDFVLNSANLKTAFSNILNGNTQMHFWFLYVIVGIYFLLPIIKIFVSNADRKQVEYSLFLFFSFVIIKYTLFGFDSRISFYYLNNVNKLGLDIAGGYVGYFILGYYLNEYPIKRSSRLWIHFISIISIIICIILTLKKSLDNHLIVEFYYHYLTIFIFIWSIEIFLTAKYSYKNVFNFAAASQASLGIYALHMLVIFELSKRGLTAYSFYPIISVPVISLGVFFISLIFSILLKKVPFIGKWVV